MLFNPIEFIIHLDKRVYGTTEKTTEILAKGLSGCKISCKG
jgi:hypothetical protein